MSKRLEEDVIISPGLGRSAALRRRWTFSRMLWVASVLRGFPCESLKTVSWVLTFYPFISAGFRLDSGSIFWTVPRLVIDCVIATDEDNKQWQSFVSIAWDSLGCPYEARLPRTGH
jgi:hypothetical protein